MHRSLTYALVGIIALCVSSSISFAQEKKTDDAFRKAAEAEEKLAQPSEEHKKLAQLAGTWKAETKFYPAPGAKPIVFNGSAQNTMILGGRFLKSESRFAGPMPVETFSLMGFDRRYGKYTYAGYDTTGTFGITAVGGFDVATSTIAMSGEETDPTLGLTSKYDVNIRLAGPDQYIVEVAFKNPEMTGGAKEFKAVEVTYTRTH